MNKTLSIIKETVTHPLTNTEIEARPEPGKKKSEADSGKTADPPAGIGGSGSGSGVGSSSKKSMDAPKGPSASRQIPEMVSKNYKLTLLAVFSITFIVLIVLVWMVISIDQMNEGQEDLTAYLKTIVSAGTGAIFGLIGGKAT